jgi:hypothetical protein
VRAGSIRVAVVAVCALALGPACGGRKVGECNALVQVVNAGVQSVERQPKPADDPSGVVGLRAMADAMDKVAANAAKVELTAPELKKISADYQTMAKDVARSAREMAAAADAKDMPKVNAAWASMEKAYNQEEPLVEGLNKFCQAP